MLLLPQRLRRLFGRPLRLGWFDHPTMHAYRPPKHPDSPERVAAVEAELRRQGSWAHLLQIQGKEATDSQIALAHSRSYLFRLEGMQPQAGKIRRIDDDTVLTNNALEAARIAAGTVIKAVDFVLAGKIRNAFCATRPPGHHAKSKQSGSFCLINHTAVAAMHAVSRHHLQRVAVLDFDVHRGDGSEEILHGQPNILLLGLSQQLFQCSPVRTLRQPRIPPYRPQRMAAAPARLQTATDPALRRFRRTPRRPPRRHAPARGRLRLADA